MSTEEKPTSIKVICSSCGGPRNCEIRGHYDQNGSDDFMSWGTNWYILQCKGCDHTFMHSRSWNSEDIEQYYDHNGESQSEANITEQYFPALNKRERPIWMSDWGIHRISTGKLDDVLTELYSSLDADLYVLAAIAIRTSFDAASEFLQIDPGGTFQEKLDELLARNLIGPSDRELLEILIDAGSATAHRGWKPSKKQIGTMMDILEDFINRAIVEPHKRAEMGEAAKKIKAVVPPKQKRPKKLKALPPPAT